MAIMFLCILIHSVKCLSFTESIVQGVWIVNYTGHSLCNMYVCVWTESEAWRTGFAEPDYLQLCDSGGTVN